MRGLLSPVLVSMLGIAIQPLHAGDKFPSTADVKKAVERSLPYLEKEGLAWIKKRDCHSCHNVSFMLWAHHEAEARGVHVDLKKVEAWHAWSTKKSLDQHVFFKVPFKTMEALPEETRKKLVPIADTGFETEDEFVAALAAKLTDTEMDRHKANLVKQSALPKKGAVNDGGGLDTMTQLFLARDQLPQPATLLFKGKNDEDFFARTAALIVKWQEPDGTWKAAGQQPGRRWPRPIADQTTTLWTILALTTYNRPDPQITKSLEKAHAAVKRGKPGDNLEWMVARLLYEKKFGTPAQTEAIQKNLLKRQNADGGWSALPAGPSEAFSTGQGLYALRLVGVADNDAILRKGQKYLIDTQTNDGSWTVNPAQLSSGSTPERLKKLEPIYRYWGSAWASIGLSRSLPGK